MARFQIKNTDTQRLMSDLSRFGNQAKEIASRAIYEGAGIVADELKEQVKSLESEEQRFLDLSDESDKFRVVEKELKCCLIEKMGISTLRDAYDGWDRHIGWDGYGYLPTKKYPKGRPIPMIAASIEIGSEVRYKLPFIRKTCNSKRKEALEAMEKSVDESTKLIFEN